jgi:SWI/SNF-related matrix-associated actin-dependent regulator of chromatin subfamily A3
MLSLIVCNGIIPDSDNYDKSTLIVAPLSVLENWKTQVHQHIAANRITVGIYHGAERKKIDRRLDNLDIVLTTYQTLASEYRDPSKHSGESGPLFGVRWRRVILDEGHVIRNKDSSFCNACVGLTALSRWVASGTPIINDINDIYSLLKFLHYRPLNEYVLAFLTPGILEVCD